MDESLDGGKPLIGITTRQLPAGALSAFPPGVAEAMFEGTFHDYSVAVAQAGGIPFPLPRSVRPSDVIPLLDGLILTGGEDIDPGLYLGDIEEMLPGSDRDIFELELIAAAVNDKMPILGICRGEQLLNVATGGTLTQHIDTDSIMHAWTEEHRSVRRHKVSLAPGSLIYRIEKEHLGEHDVMWVNSYHHQAVADAGQGLRAVGWATDGIVEAVESEDGLIVGVQWHPEMHAGLDPVFNWLVEAASGK
jgi:putative glutamine amidotransferase